MERQPERHHPSALARVSWPLPCSCAWPGQAALGTGIFHHPWKLPCNSPHSSIKNYTKLKKMNKYPKKRKRKTLHPSRYSDSSGISKIADGLNGIFSDHCYSVCSVRQPDLKYFDNKNLWFWYRDVEWIAKIYRWNLGQKQKLKLPGSQSCT